jgi:hypothetical protein
MDQKGKRNSTWCSFLAPKCDRDGFSHTCWSCYRSSGIREQITYAYKCLGKKNYDCPYNRTNGGLGSLSG